jgi:uncharacterized membrane protein YkgB
MKAVGYIDLKSSSKVSDKENLVERISVVSEKVGNLLATGGLSVVIGWIGLLKFTPAEASAIEPFARHSPLSGWVFNYLTVQQFSNVVGLTELLIVGLLLFGFVNRSALRLGAVLATGMFLTTLSFLFTTPGVVDGTVVGFIPALTVPGQFLLKDIVLLGVALRTFGRRAE